MKKKFIGLVLGMVLVLGVTACGGQETEQGSSSGQESQTKQEGEQSKEQTGEQEMDEVEKEAAREAAESWYYISRTEDRNVYYFANGNEEVVAIDRFNGVVSSKDLEFHYNVNCISDENYDDVLIDVTGKNITEPGEFDSINRANKELYMAEKDNQWGLINYKGEVVVPLEFKNIRYYEDYETGYFIGEPEENGQYAMYSSEGVELFRTNEELSNDDIRLIIPTTPQCVVFEYQEAVYSLQDGSKIAELTDGAKWYFNMYYNDGKVTAFDENLKVSDELVLEDFHDFVSYNEDEWRVKTKGDEFYILNEEYKFVKVPEVNRTEHTLENGKKYKSSIDEAAETLTISDEAGNALCTISIADVYMPSYVEVCGNYLTLKAKKGNFFIDIEKGELFTEGVSYMGTDENGVVNVMHGSGSSAYHTYFNDDFLLTTNENCLPERYQGGFWIIDKGTGVAKSYNLKGEIIEEITGIKEHWTMVDACFMLILEGGSSKVISNEDGKVIWELQYTEDMMNERFFPYAYREDGIGVLELEDGFYDLEGKCVLKK